MMNPPKTLKERFRKEVAVAEALWTVLDVGVEKLPYSADELARAVAQLTNEDMRHELVSRYIEAMINDGSIVRRGPVYGTKTNGLNVGRNYGWTLAVDQATALERIARRQEQDAAAFGTNRLAAGKAAGKARTKAAKERKVTDNSVTIATTEFETTRAIAGPEPDSTMRVKVREAIRGTRKAGDASALVEAARQYASRGTSMKAQIDDLVKTAEGMGLTVDREALEKTLSFQPDERLETVALVLPYIEMLEAAVERGIDNVKELQRKYSDYDEMRRALRHFREERDRKLVSGVATSN